MEILEFFSYILLFFSTIYSLIKISSLIKNKQITGFLFLLPVIFLFYVLPEFMDYITDIKFDNYYYIYEAMQDKLTTSIYNIYLSILIVFFTRQAVKYGKNKFNNYSFNNKDGLIVISLLRVYNKSKILIWIIFIFPIFTFLISGNYEYYSTYLTRDFLFIDAIPESHQYLTKIFELSALLGAFIITAILSEKKFYKVNKNYLLIIIFSVLIAVFWLHGKRSIIASFGFTLIMLLFITKVFSTKKLVRLTLLSIALFVGFISFYGKNIQIDSSDTYRGLRTDFSRDYGVRFAIYNDLILERHILPNKFETFIFNATFFVPREIWKDKPHPYAVYFTNSAFGNFGEDTSYGWGLTTSIFSESISNISFFGLFLAPLILNFILKREALSTNIFFKIISIIISILLLVLHPIAFMVLILTYLIMLFREKRKILS